MAEIVVVGSVNLDLSASVARLPEPGETITGAKLSRFPGGKGANQALAARRLGADVRLVACVGEDAAADEALALLREAGVDLSRLQVLPGNPTGIALICVAPSGENQIVVAPGANAAMAATALELGSADALICQLEVPGAAIAAAANSFEGYTLIDAAVAYRFGKNRVSLSAMNLTDKRYVTYFSDTRPATGSNTSDSTYFAGRGRTFTLGLTREF